MPLYSSFSSSYFSEMSTTLSKCPSLNIDGDAKIMGKQGIVTILRSDCERTKAASLRRTLSADMSSKKWLAQNGLSPMRKNASSDQLSVSLADSSSSSEGEECYEESKEQLQGQGQSNIWSSIQEEQKQKKELEKPGQFDIWSSIISQKANEDTSTPLLAPYIHPLVKRSSSSLSEKSLQICTESLGSETGSDGFSSYPSSETGDAEDEKEEEEEEELQEDLKGLSQAFDMEESRIPKYHYASSKKSQPRSFPPPLPSLSRRDGASLRMQSRRDNGRLVLEAVSIPSQNHFRAQRKDGRLVLTFFNDPTNEDARDEEMVEDVQRQEEEEAKTHKEAFEEEIGDFEEVYGEEVGEENEETEEREEDEEVDEEADNGSEPKEIEIVMEPAPKMSSTAVSFHRLALMAKPIRMAERNPAWPGKFNVGKFEDDDAEVEEVDETASMAKSLPLRPRVGRFIPSPTAVPSTAAAASLNAYEYYWRAKPSTANPISQPPTTSALKNNGNKLIISKTPMTNEQQQQQLFVLRGNKGNYFVPLIKSCKEPRRSLLIWEPYCIAT
ncbi:hypothetical protein I3843_13G112900 [Carya illinoinensis]|uniref:FAF domain-containing protein n=1 Tax=Carya illinoinensis TaxID=32201 RepID=A0A922ANY7_CARIL|nr:hypothetical protein I3760_13G127500 [Carya illinoinensis]KAG6682217.1 hypothetical protein I3842_13G127300 [Carya illinoinensis]KAG7950442.1 hypothetical protein I3843_13G112900 [Carya illinoinensis]